MAGRLNIFPLGGTLRVKRDQLLFRLRDLDAKRVAIWGAGRNGDSALCLLAGTGIEVVALFDSKPAASSHGMAARPEPDGFVEGVDCVLIAMNGPTEVVRRIVGVCEASGVPYLQLVDQADAVDAAPDAKALRLADFAGRHKGRRCFVAGNGPSLNKIDMAKLKDEIVFGSNRCYIGFERWGLRFPYWGVEDMSVGGWQSEGWRELTGVMKFVPEDMLQLARPGDPELCPVHFARLPFQDKEPLFSVYPEIAFHGKTVTYLLLQLAAIMGCDPIYLIGVDFHFTQDNVRLENEGSTWRQVKGDLNHFDPSYIPEGRYLDRPYWEQQRFAFQSAKRASEAYGFRIFNATPGSKLDVFERVDYESLFPADKLS